MPGTLIPLVYESQNVASSSPNNEQPDEFYCAPVKGGSHVVICQEAHYNTQNVYGTISDSFGQYPNDSMITLASIGSHDATLGDAAVPQTGHTKLANYDYLGQETRHPHAADTIQAFLLARSQFDTLCSSQQTQAGYTRKLQFDNMDETPELVLSPSAYSEHTRATLIFKEKLPRVHYGSELEPVINNKNNNNNSTAQEQNYKDDTENITESMGYTTNRVPSQSQYYRHVAVQENANEQDAQIQNQNENYFSSPPLVLQNNHIEDTTMPFVYPTDYALAYYPQQQYNYHAGNDQYPASPPSSYLLANQIDFSPGFYGNMVPQHQTFNNDNVMAGAFDSAYDSSPAGSVNSFFASSESSSNCTQDYYNLIQRSPARMPGQLSLVRNKSGLENYDEMKDTTTGPEDQIFSLFCPYPNCNKQFSRLHNLKSHMIVHSEDKPFKCNQCEMAFRRNHDLRRHTRLHLGVKPFQCPKCPKRFCRSDALRRHIRVDACGEPVDNEYLVERLGLFPPGSLVMPF